jgi:hypothetical protein
MSTVTYKVEVRLIQQDDNGDIVHKEHAAVFEADLGIATHWYEQVRDQLTNLKDCAISSYRAGLRDSGAES